MAITLQGVLLMDVTLEKLQGDLALIRQRKEHTMNAFHQICGAESAIEQMIAHASMPEPEEQNSGLPSDDHQETSDNQ